MRFAPRQTAPLLLLPLAALTAGCASTVTLGSVPACSRLVSASGLLLPTEPAEIPFSEDVRDWQVGFTEQSGQLQKANDDKAAAGRVMTECEAMHREALKRATRPWWKFW